MKKIATHDMNKSCKHNVDRSQIKNNIYSIILFISRSKPERLYLILLEVRIVVTWRMEGVVTDGMHKRISDNFYLSLDVMGMLILG